MEVMFADDKNSFLSHNTIDIRFDSTNVELEIVLTWFKSSKLSLNVGKTKCFSLHPLSKREILPQTLPKLLMEKTHVNREPVTKFLDVFINENLSWKDHIHIVSSRMSKSIGILSKSRDVLSKESYKQLYFLFIHNYINYVNSA